VRVALSYRSTGKSATTVLTLPSLADLTKGDSPCACGQATAQLRRGFELHGAVLSVNASAGTAVVKHEAIPGVMPAMTMQFRADATTLAALVPGQELLGRMEDRNAEWWLFDVRLLGPTVPEKR
jgi:Cu/Ag efflux protein CusF